MKSIKTIIFFVLILLLIIFLGFLGYSLYKTNKIKGLVDHLNNYEKELTNAFVQKDIKKDEKTVVVKTYYKSTEEGNKYLMETVSDGERKIVYDNDQGKTYNYTEKDGKSDYYKSDGDTSYEKIPRIYLRDNDFMNIFVDSLKIKISSVESEGKQYYKLESKSDNINFDEIYVDKETNLITRKVDLDGDIKYTYNFNEIDESVFNIPKK